ncbi:leucyl aminopeptidase [bacterium]|nr:leucyl aminopeptidase [bacterium]
MEINISTLSTSEATGEILVAGLYEGESLEQNALNFIDKLSGGSLTTAMKRGGFSGKKSDTLFLYNSTDSGPNYLMLLGLGKRDAYTLEGLRRRFGDAGKEVRGKKYKTASVLPPVAGMDTAAATDVTVAITEGFSLATYRYTPYFGDQKDVHPLFESLQLIAEAENKDAVLKGAELAQITIAGTLLARDLVALPGMDLYPESYAEMAKTLADDHITVEILDEKQLRDLGMGALSAVGQGSARPPRLIHLSYDPKIENAKTLAVVGKGITFDAGGLDIKTAAGMRDMKVDMAGSAAVMGLFKALPMWKPNCRVEGFIPAAENMPSHNAYRPGDVLTSYKGITIEIDNTDAEGRLALADALAYAVDTVKPDAIIDLATLTGACVIALGHHGTGLCSNNDELVELMSNAGEKTGERVWRLPLWEEFTDQIRSQIADIKNTGGRPGGTITAAAFLQQFIGDTPWVHLDIAGTANEVTLSYTPHRELPTGVGVRLLLEFLRNWA